MSPHHIITAHHCLMSEEEQEDIYVVVGSRDREGGGRFKVEEVIRHPCYDELMTNYDVAVLRVEEVRVLKSNIFENSF